MSRNTEDLVICGLDCKFLRLSGPVRVGSCGFVPQLPGVSSSPDACENEAGGCGGGNYPSLLMLFTLPHSLRDFPRLESSCEWLKAASLGV